MNKSPISPGQCIEVLDDGYLDTCRANNIVSVRIEGELEDKSDWTYKEQVLDIETLNTEAPTQAPTPPVPVKPNNQCSVQVCVSIFHLFSNTCSCFILVCTYRNISHPFCHFGSTLSLNRIQISV